MTEVVPSPAAAALRRELDFVKSLLRSGRSVAEMVAAANAAARLAARAAEEAKRSAQKGGTELTVRGLPIGDGWDWRSFKRWMQSRGVIPKSIKYAEKAPDSDVGVVRLGSEAECSAAADLLATCEPPTRGSRITVERGVPQEFGNKFRKRGREGDEEAPVGSRGPKAARAPDVCEAVCPWWRVPYGKQLTDKHQRIVEAMAQITYEVDRRTFGASKPAWVLAARDRADSTAAAAITAASGAAAAAASVCCPLLGILRSPAIERYRNKSEFTSGLDEQDKPSVGFLRGAFMDGITCVGAPDETRHTSTAAIKMAAVAAAYLRDVSQFPVYDKRTHEGYWRLVLVREGSRNSFLPVPAVAAAAAGSESVEPHQREPQQVLESPTFASLDPYSYLVTFGSSPVAVAAQPAAAVKPAGADTDADAEMKPAEAEAGAAEAAKAVESAGADVDAEMKPAEAQAGEAGAAEMAKAEGEAVAGRGMDVTVVSEAEPERPPPDEVLVMLQVNPNYTRALAEPATAARELRAMAAALHAGATAAGLPLSTVRVQYHTGVSNAAPYDAPMLEIPSLPTAEAGAEDAGAVQQEDAAVAAAVAACSGSGYIHDSLCELKFRISPNAFFQVNSPATCSLYKVVGDWAAASPSTLLLDICCGTGTIGLTMASRVSKVVGVDNVLSAVEDARVNAALNGITNADFVAGKAEDALPGILAAHADAYSEGDVVAVADPPRAGLHRSVLRALLGCSKIRRLVFVSCNPDNLVQNVAMLCTPPDNRSGRGRSFRGGRGRDRQGDESAASDVGNYVPFRPVKALAVDLFPHTAHVEAVMLLER